MHAELRRPEALAFDAKGNLFISDSGNNIVRKVSAQLILASRTLAHA